MGIVQLYSFLVENPSEDDIFAKKQKGKKKIRGKMDKNSGDKPFLHKINGVYNCFFESIMKCVTNKPY